MRQWETASRTKAERVIYLYYRTLRYVSSETTAKIEQYTLQTVPYTRLRTWYKMVTANSVKFSSVSSNMSPSNTGEPSRSTFDAQSLLFGLRSRHDCENTIISFALLSVRTIWAAKHRTKVHHCAKIWRFPSNRSSDSYDLYWCLSSSSRNHVAWRHFWNGSDQCFEIVLVFPCLFTDRTSLELKKFVAPIFFFSKFGNQIGSAAYTLTFTVDFVRILYTLSIHTVYTLCIDTCTYI